MGSPLSANSELAALPYPATPSLCSGGRPFPAGEGERKRGSIQFQQSCRIAAADLGVLRRGQADLVDELDALHLERDHRRRVGAENELVLADGLETHLGGERGVTR